MLKEFKWGNETFFNVTEECLLNLGVTQLEINLAKMALQKEDVFKNRRLAYKFESDPYYMEWQYDQSSEKEQAWRDKVAEIKIRYPLPTAP